jgi:predicted amidohydrolase
MIHSLKIAVLPMDIATGQKRANLQALTTLMDRVDADTDVVVMPELFTTAFVPDALQLHALAETNEGTTITTVRALARKHRMALAGSFFATNAEGTCFSNRAFFVEPSGEATFYDKRHLFSLSPEAEMLTPGATLPPVVRFRGWNIALTVCYDLRFPAWCRSRRSCPYDVMLVPANWPTARAYAWEHLLQARAIENQAYYVGANRAGTDDYGTYGAELSIITDYYGKPIGTMSADSDIVYAVTNRELLTKARKYMPAANDADDFIIKI